MTTQQAPKAGYGVFGPYAHEYHTHRSGYPDSVFNAIMQHYMHVPAEKDPLRVLDIGCGTGLSTHGIVRALPKEKNIEMFGLDKDASMIAQARDFFSQTIKLNPGVAIQWREGTIVDGHIGRMFDLIVCASAFHWVHTEKGATDKIRSILNKSNFELDILHPFVVINRKLSDEYLQRDMRSIANRFTERAIPDVKEKYNPVQILHEHKFGNVSNEHIKYSELIEFEKAIERFKTASFWQEVPLSSRTEADKLLRSLAKEKFSAEDNAKIRISYDVELTVGYRM